MKTIVSLVLGILLLAACSDDTTSRVEVSGDYLDNTGRDDVLSGGIRLIPVDTPKGSFRVWTKRIGNNPDI